MASERRTWVGSKCGAVQWPDSLCHRALLSLLPQRATRTSCLDSINNVRSIKVL